MKRKLIILMCFMVLSTCIFGQSYWGDIVYHGSFENSMGVNIKAVIDNEVQTSSEMQVGVFCGDELRGFANIENVNNLGIHLALIQVYGKSGESFSFRLSDGESELYSGITKEYNENGYGTLSNPLVLDFFTPVAKVNDIYFKTFAEALAAVTANSTLTLLDNVTIADPINVTANLTIDGNGKTLTYTGSGASARAITVESKANGANLTVENLTVDCTASYCQRGINYNTTGELSLDNVIVKGTNVTYALNLPSSSNGAKVTINGSSLTSNIALNVWGKNAEINATDSQFTSVDKTDAENYAAIVLNNDGTTSAEGSVITITGGSITALDQNNEWSSATSNATATGVITISETTTVVGYTAEMIAAVKYTNTTDSYGCKTLEAAINKASNDPNATVVLLKNTQGSGVVIDGNVTIDFGGHTYTFTSPAVGSNGTQTLGFQILKGHDVVLKNGTLNVAEEAGESFAMLIQNYSDLTITNMTLDGDNLNRNNYSYVLSVNCGDVVINGSTSILANVVEGEKHFAFDSYDYSAGGYTELPTVTVYTTGAIKGAIEVSATLDIKAIGEESAISYISIEGKGQLFHNGIATTIKKNIEGTVTDGWYTISSPVGNVTHENVSGLINGTHDLFRYNETTMIWENVKVATNGFTTLEAGRGYLYANTADTELGFKGTLNTAAASQELTITDNALSGFNLVGNPFTYNITKDNMWGATLAQGFYTLSNHGAWQANNESATIAPMQGALIKATALTGDFTINPNSAKRGESEDNGSIKINVANGNYNDLAYVSFNEGIGLDKIDHRNANVPMVYVPVDGVNYAIAMMSQDVTEIPVSFRAMTMGEYTIAVEAQNCEFAMMTLVDRLTGIETNLLIEDYTFIAKTNDNPDRFFIKLAKANNNDGSEENFAFINNNMMYIYNIEGQGVVNVYDVTGRPVAEFNVSESANISTSDFASGMYIIRMSDENGIKVQKIVIE